MTYIASSAPEQSHDTVTPELMRAALGAFCTGVVVVTALGPGPDEQPLGFTCQSFASLSLDPPLVSFSPSRTSTTWPRIRDAGIFAVNVLAHDHAELSGKFARSGTDKYEGVEWVGAPLGSPVLIGVSAWVECRLWREYDGGDHTVVIGQVTAVDHDAARNPLLYYRGAYPEALWQAS